MSYEFSQKWHRDKLSGLGTDATIGPDQPWTAANAGQWITRRTRECSAGKEILIGTTVPPSYVGGKKVTTAECFATGRVKETTKPGYQRVQEWCCPVIRLNVPVTKALTQAQAVQYATTCAGRTLSFPDGRTFPLDLGYWLHKIGGNVPTALCQDSGVTDGDYTLLCCRPPPDADEIKAAHSVAGSSTKVTRSPVALTAEQIAESTAAVAENVAEREAVLVAAQEPQYSFFQRYGLVLALGAGAVGIGVLAGLIKRKRLNKTDEK